MLSNAGCLENFVRLVTSIAEGTMSCMNISFLLCLDVAKLHSCITTTAMRFHHETKQFWEVVYKVCKGKGLHLFSGSKNRGCLQSKKMDRGSYDPALSNHNFAVPDIKSLVNNCADIPNLIFPGILEGAMKMLDKSKQYVLSVDGKKIAAGLGKPLCGDINLWGHEKPNLEEALRQRNEDIEFIKNIEKEINNIDADSEVQPKIKFLPTLLAKMTQYISGIRSTEIGHRKLLKKLEKLAKNNPDKKKNYIWNGISKSICVDNSGLDSESTFHQQGIMFCYE